MRGFGSDGASNMIGVRDGVGAYFKREIPSIVQTHCISHRLALAGKDSAVDVPYVKEFFDILDQVSRCYNYSAVRTTALREIQVAFDDPVLKLSRAIDTRWLSKGKACMNLKKVFRAVLTSLSREASERDDAQALGLYSFMTKKKFIYTLYFMCDIMPELIKLAKLFQSDNFDYARVKFHINGSKDYFARLVEDENQAKTFMTVDNDIDSILSDFISSDRGRHAHNFHFYYDVAKPYLASLINNLGKRFPSMDTVDAFRMFEARRVAEYEIYENGMTNLQTLLVAASEDEAFNIDATVAETEWLTLSNELQKEKEKASSSEVSFIGGELMPNHNASCV